MADRVVEPSCALAGQRIVVTRAGRAGATFVARLREYGAVAEHVPAITFRMPDNVADLDHALASLQGFDWIVFTSANAVDAFVARLTTLALDGSGAMPRIAAVGASTASAIVANGWRVSFVPSYATGHQLASELPVEQGARILVPRTNIADTSLPDVLRARGVVVEDVVAYCTAPDPDLDVAVADVFRNGPIDALTFTSPSCITAFVDAAQRNGVDLAHLRRAGMRVVCIGLTTAAAARAHHLEPDGISDEPSVDGIIRVLAACLWQPHLVQTV